MAITNLGTQNLISANQIPATYTRPIVATFTDDEYTSSSLSLTMTKASVENADKAVTMAAIVAAITAQIDIILAADYLGTATITAYTDLMTLSNNHASLDGLSVWLDTTAVSYICGVKLYVKTA